MSAQPSTGLITIGALSKATGIPVETIRTWERRYGFPSPTRTQTGHRRYHPECILRLRLIKKALHLGHRPAAVVPADPTTLESMVNLSQGPTPVFMEPRGDDMKPLLDAIRAFDAQMLQQILNRQNSLLGLRNLIHTFISPLIRLVGLRWQEGQLSVAQEHFFTEQVAFFMSSQWRSLNSQTHRHWVLCTTLEDERHLLGLHMAATIMATHGLNISFLGGPTPADAIIESLGTRRFTHLAISLSACSQPEKARAIIEDIRERHPQLHIVLGGRNAPTLPGRCQTFRDLTSLESWLCQHMLTLT